MDELELRIAAVEWLLIEMAYAMGSAERQRLAASIRSSLTDDMTADERAIKLGALELLERGGARHQLFGPGRA